MTHLPECWLSEGKFDAVCLCDRLRACEQRVLDAAREAVAALKIGPLTTGTLLLKREDTLAAIRALTKEAPIANA